MYKRQVQDLAGLGVDVIMVAVADTFDGTPTLTNAQLRAITSTAHARGLRVVAHVDTAANAARAAGSGVDALVHGVHSTALDDVAAERVARHVSMVAPTLLTFERLDQMGQGTLVLSPLEQQSVATDLQRELPRAAASGYRPPAALLPWLGDLRTHRDDRFCLLYTSRCV